MNLYKICYTSPEHVPLEALIIERSKATAVKRAEQTCDIKRINHIELLRKNVPATKEQEQETLDAIRQMISDLGPRSYLAAAFAGCCDVAEANINGDFHDSMKFRLTLADLKADELTRKLHKAETRIAQLESGPQAESPSRWCVSWGDCDGNHRETVFDNVFDAVAEAILLVLGDYENVSLEGISGGEPLCSKTS